MKKNYRTLNRGQGLVEFSLLLPILMLFLMVIIDLGRAAYYYSAIQNAAREGARYGIVHKGDVNGTEAAAIKITAGLLGNSNITAGFQYEPDGGGWIDSCPQVDNNEDVCLYNPSGDLVCDFKPVEAVCVNIIYDFEAATPLLGKLLGTCLPGSCTNSITLRTKAIMRLE